MRVAFNARTLSASQLRGWSRYTRNLVRELTQLGVQVYLFSDRKLNEDLLKGCDRENLKVIVKRGFFYIHWEQKVLPELCDEYEIDVLHCPINYGLPLKRNCKQVLTLHDAIEKAFYGERKNFLEQLDFNHLYVRSLHKVSQSAADLIITVSKHAKRDIEKHYGISGEKIKVVYEAADSDFKGQKKRSLEELGKKFSIQGQYLFYMGGLEKRKNIDFMLQSFAELESKNCQLVIAGGGSEIGHYKQQILDYKLSGRVLFLGWVEDEWVPSLYHHSRGFVYPSLYEGFGLQIVEAMVMGCPVICSNVTSLPEILNFDEATFDPTKNRELTSVMERLINDDIFYKKLKAHGKARGEQFSWQRTAEKTLEIYNLILKE